MSLTAKTSYISVSDAQVYFDGRLDTEDWDDATDTDKTKSLIQASTMIDNLDYKGDYFTPRDANGKSQQEHEFPRDYNFDGQVPTEVLYACCELAKALLGGFDSDREIDALNIISQGLDTARSTYDTATPMHLRAGMPASAFNYLGPHVRDPRALVITRCS